MAACSVVLTPLGAHAADTVPPLLALALARMVRSALSFQIQGSAEHETRKQTV